MSKWTKNVGTPDHPVSYLHEYAVALIWDRLSAGECFVRTTSNKYEHLIVPTGGRIAIPDELTPIGGMVPDIAIYDSDHRPVSVVEVQVTSSPSENKRVRLGRLGVNIFIVPVPDEDALLTMFKPVPIEELLPYAHIPDQFYGHTKLINKQMNDMGVLSRRGSSRRSQIGRALEQSNETVANLIQALKTCDPSLRQKLRAVLDELDSIESQHPILSGNPKLAALRQEDKEDEVE